MLNAVAWAKNAVPVMALGGTKERITKRGQAAC
jgi:hypothetical protein